MRRQSSAPLSERTGVGSATLRPADRGVRTGLDEPAASADRNQSVDASEAARATVAVDREGIIRQWGDAVTEVVGHSADDTVGRSLNVVIPPALRPLHWWGFDQAMKTGRLNREMLTVPALRKDGRIV